jgi:hypothetical protein
MSDKDVFGSGVIGPGLYAYRLGKYQIIIDPFDGGDKVMTCVKRMVGDKCIEKYFNNKFDIDEMIRQVDEKLLEIV